MLALASRFHEPEVLNTFGKIRTRANALYDRKRTLDGRFKNSSDEELDIIDSASKEQLISMALMGQREAINPLSLFYQQNPEHQPNAFENWTITE